MANRRVKVIIEGTYELIPELYDPSMTPEQMMKIDENNANLDEIGILESLEGVKVTFKLVK